MGGTFVYNNFSFIELYGLGNINNQYTWDALFVFEYNLEHCAYINLTNNPRIPDNDDIDGLGNAIILSFFLQLHTNSFETSKSISTVP